jgi:hypothetical protein
MLHHAARARPALPIITARTVVHRSVATIRRGERHIGADIVSA